MRSTIEILAELEDNGRPDYEELRMAWLVQKSILFFIHNDIRRLLKGGIAAAITKQSYPEKNADLGISSWEWEAMRKDPIEYLGPDHIPGTPEWEAFHRVANAVIEKAMKQERSNETRQGSGNSGAIAFRK